jgi:hypothetical protein
MKKKRHYDILYDDPLGSKEINVGYFYGTSMGLEEMCSNLDEELNDGRQEKDYVATYAYVIDSSNKYFQRKKVKQSD